MTDSDTTLQDVKDWISAFVDAREWGRFHSPKNLAIAIAVEAAELMDLFKWADAADDLESQGRLRQELADVVIYCLALANRSSIDLSDSISEKLELNDSKYPAEEFRGRVRR